MQITMQCKNIPKNATIIDCKVYLQYYDRSRGGRFEIVEEGMIIQTEDDKELNNETRGTKI